MGIVTNSTSIMCGGNVKTYWPITRHEMITNWPLTQHKALTNWPDSTRSANKAAHSFLKQLAPVRLPSPPMHTKLVMPRDTRFLAAFSRPGLSLNSMHLALPITVPPCNKYNLSIHHNNNVKMYYVVHCTAMQRVAVYTQHLDRYNYYIRNQ